MEVVWMRGQEEECTDFLRKEETNLGKVVLPTSVPCWGKVDTIQGSEIVR